MAWKFGLCDLSGVSIGEVFNASERKLSIPLNGIPTASFQVRLDNPLATEIADSSGDILLKVYQNSTLRFIGECTSIEERGADQNSTVACNFAGPFWRLQKRLTGKSTTGRTFTDVQRNTLVSELLTEANADKDTGIRIGTFASLDPISAGTWHYKPVAEAISEVAATKAPARNAWDNFDLTPTGSLTGESLRIGGTWLGYGGNANDFVVAGSGNLSAVRTAISDAGTQKDGRTVVASGPTLSNVVGHMDFTHDSFAASGITAQSGFVFRFVDEFNYFILNTYRAIPAGFFVIQALKIVGGTVTQLTGGAFTHPYTFQANIGYSMQGSIDDAGVVTVWLVQTGEPFGNAYAAWSDSALATGGVLEDGQVGITDWYSNTTACSRYYDNVSFWDPTGTIQSFDFEIVPSEPTPDTNQDGVVGAGLEIGSMNVSGTLGTTTTAVFEYGTGNRSVKAYHHATTRDGLLTRGHSLPNDFPTGTAVMSHQDDAAITARGLFEEVVTSDLVDSLLRQTLVEAHVRVRSVPREVITFEPSSTAPVFGDDYTVGDIVIARAMVNGSVRFNGEFRVYGVDISIDENGKEEIVPTLLSE